MVKNDFVQTPKYVTEALLERESFEGSILDRIAEAITAPWSSDRAITNDSAEIVDSDAVCGDSDGQDTDDADDGEYS